MESKKGEEMSGRQADRNILTWYPTLRLRYQSRRSGRAERKLRHILDVVRAITLAATTPSSFLGEAALTAVYTINRCPSPIIKNQTPCGLLFGSSPSYDLLRLPNGRETIPDVSTIRSLSLFAASAKTKVIPLRHATPVSAF